MYQLAGVMWNDDGTMATKTPSPLETLKYIENFENKRFFNVKYDNGEQAHYEYQTIKDLFPKEFEIIEAALKRLVELEEENKVLETVRDNFELWIEPKYRGTLQLLQCCSMTQSEYKKFIEYFGEPNE